MLAASLKPFLLTDFLETLFWFAFFISFKDFDISNLYKKCGFRKADGFELRHKYEKVKVNGDRIDVHVFARNNGKSGTENKIRVMVESRDKAFTKKIIHKTKSILKTLN